jgi:hypothetical protein
MSAYKHPSALTGLQLYACSRQLLDAGQTPEASEQALIDRGVPPARAKEVIATLIGQRNRQAMERTARQLLQSDRPTNEVVSQLARRGFDEEQALDCVNRVRKEEAIQRGYRLGIHYRWWGMILTILAVILFASIRHAAGQAAVRGDVTDLLVLVAAIAVAGVTFFAGSRLHRAGKDRTGLG